MDRVLVLQLVQMRALRRIRDMLPKMIIGGSNSANVNRIKIKMGRNRKRRRKDVVERLVVYA